jgi:hypothetical protein
VQNPWYTVLPSDNHIDACFGVVVSGLSGLFLRGQALRVFGVAPTGRRKI